MEYHNTITIKLSQYLFNLKARKPFCFPIDKNIAGFISTQETTSADVNIKITTGKPTLREDFKLLTNARNLEEIVNGENIKHYYKLFRTDKQFLVISGYENKDLPERYMLADLNYKNWTVFVPETSNGHLENPLQFPLGSMIYYYGLSALKNLLLHASGIKYKEKGFIFSGQSGIGKTTITKLWHNAGASVINDDRLLIHSDDNQKITMFNSPMMYPQKLMQSPVNAIFLLKQASKNYMTKLNTIQAFASVTAQCIQHNHDKNLVSNMMSSVKNIITHIPVFELGFVPDSSVVDFILEKTRHL